MTPFHFTACLLTLLYRAEYETTLSDKSHVQPDGQPLEWAIPTDASDILTKDVIVEDGQEDTALAIIGEPVDIKTVPVFLSGNAREVGVVVPRASKYPLLTPFTTPVASLAFITYILSNVPVVLLSSDHPVFGLRYLLQGPEMVNNGYLKTALTIFTLVPPVFIAMLAVPFLVILACGFGLVGRGRNILAYCEERSLSDATPDANSAGDYEVAEKQSIVVEEKSGMSEQVVA